MSRGFSVIYSAMLLLCILGVIYSYIQAFYIPALCKNVESDFILQLTRDALDFVSTADKVMNGDGSTTYTFILSGDYPKIPFFVTPPYYSATITTYKAKFNLTNIKYYTITDVLGKDNPTDHLSLNTTTINIRPLAGFIKNYEIFIEYGQVIVCINNHCHFIKNNFIEEDENGNKYINLQLYETSKTNRTQSVSGGTLSITLEPISTGKDQIIITNFNPTNITLTFTSSNDLTAEAWCNYFREKGYSCNTINNIVQVELPKGVKYYLKGGIIGLSYIRTPIPYYIVSYSFNKTVPSEVSVYVYDRFGHPVPNTAVHFMSANPLNTITICNATGCYTNNAIAYSDPSGKATVFIKSGSGVLMARLVRPIGGTYDEIFYLQ